MPRIKKSIKDEIIELYFVKRYSYSGIIAYYDNKYTYAEIRKIILENEKNMS